MTEARDADSGSALKIIPTEFIILLIYIVIIIIIGMMI